MQKIILITLLLHLGGGLCMTQMERMRQLDLVNAQTGIKNKINIDLDGKSPVHPLSAENGRSLCATVIAQQCIPPCRKYHGKAARYCSPREKQQHILIYFLLKK